MNSLDELHKKYANVDVNSLNSIYDKYIKRRQDSLTDSIASATAIGSIFLADKIDYASLTPRMKEAFSISFPNKNLDELENLDSEQLTGIISNWKGKLFEIEVRDKLNNGELVGDIQLETGQYAVIADELNQPGWDLEIFNADGTVAEALQLKATNSLSYINEAFEKYPDIDIISTLEISEFNEDLINSNITLEDLEAELHEPLEALNDSFGEDIIESIIPGLPFLIISLSEGRKVFIGQQTTDKAVERVIDRGVKTGVSMGAGALIGWVTGMPWLGVATSLITRLVLASDTVEDKKELQKLAELISIENKKLTEYTVIYVE
ncbi:hypothetical protein [Aestuariibaculum suncheonense]|uniref:Uncharacterized protein n=1 Tax=Aestuariibaculum suncheonense TaxID=1028745 RepID=A0A8J6UJ36_9FLAO|nr:hypothetical protein [Aestuariibaculum suncheonense]MBD0834481.1 hypothetical protein [Aestuariibaculum suncheonense]